MHKRSLLFMALLALLFLAFTASSFAAVGRLQKIDAFFGDFKIVIKGQDFSPSLSFRLNDGTIMVPLRDIATALGENVTWDAQSNTVFVGKIPEGAVFIPPKKSVPIEDLVVLRNVGPFYQKNGPWMIAGRPFEGGVAVKLTAADAPSSADDTFKGKETVLDLQGKYSNLSGYIGVEDETKNSSGGFILSIYGDERLLHRTNIVKPSFYPYQISVDVEGVKRLTLHVDWVKSATGDYDELIAVLAKFRVE